MFGIIYELCHIIKISLYCSFLGLFKLFYMFLKTFTVIYMRLATIDLSQVLYG